MTFGERILNARVKQNLTVHEVAAQLSISETTLRRYELDQLCAVLDRARRSRLTTASTSKSTTVVFRSTLI